MATYNSRAVVKISLLGEKLKSFPSIKIASEECNIPGQNIIGVCKGQRKTAGGYKWDYNENFSKENYFSQLEEEGGKLIPQYPNYFIFSDGRVFGTQRDRFLKQYPNPQGYMCIVVLNIDEKRETRTVHRFVARCFIPNPDKKPFVNHKDGNVKNNHYENLEWVTGSENTSHAIREGIQRKYTRAVSQYTKDGELVAIYPSIQAAADALGVTRGSATDACRGKYKTCQGFVLKYSNKSPEKEEGSEETWVEMPDLSGYEVSDRGRIYSQRSKRVLSLCSRQNGKQTITLRGKSYCVHRLVAEQFVPKTSEKNVFHKDGNPANNNAENLEWK